MKKTTLFLICMAFVVGQVFSQNTQLKKTLQKVKTKMPEMAAKAPQAILPYKNTDLPTDIPAYYSYKPSARRGYAFDDVSPLYPFGHGLSYTTFSYSPPSVSSAKMDKNGSITVSVNVTNTGKRDGSEVVQLYIRDVVSSVTRPVKELKDFKKINLKAGETQTVTFTITPDKLSFYNREMKRIVEAGEFEVMIGTSSVVNQMVKFSVVD